MISVLVPTRGRIDKLHVMLTTLYETASDVNNVEVVARVDEDDTTTIDYIDALPQIIGVCLPRIGYAKNARMVNECASMASGNLLLVANDDLVFKTKDWDLRLEARASGYADGMFDLGVDTVLNNANFCFPCVSRELVDLFGFFFDERLLYPDIWMRDVMMPFGRAVHVPEVTILHDWSGMTPDQERALHMTIGDPFYPALYARCVDEAREKVRYAIETVAA
jgi:hypothetical protein